MIISKTYQCDICGKTEIGGDDWPDGWYSDVLWTRTVDGRDDPEIGMCKSCAAPYRAELEPIIDRFLLVSEDSETLSKFRPSDRLTLLIEILREIEREMMRAERKEEKEKKNESKKEACCHRRNRVHWRQHV